MHPSILENKTLIGPSYAPDLISELEKARHEINIIMYVWTQYPDDPFCDPARITHLILDAHRRGVKVRILTQFPATKNWLCSLGLNARVINNTQIVHAKFVSIDRKLCYNGSHNFSKSALTSNIEISTKHYDEQSIKQLNDYFNSLWQ
jgi:phosphatidylserine/phosphatidylglycerophosphate/cardiolipin synthase-like enzyme